jgi:hypothetical protein
MKLNTVLKLLTPLMLIAGAAFGATSGLPVDPTVTTFVHFISTDVAYGLVGAGFGGIAVHCVTGRDFGFTLQHSVGALIGGGFCSQVQPAAAVLGLSAGATLNELPFIDSHHKMVAFVIGLTLSAVAALVCRSERQVGQAEAV